MPGHSHSRARRGARRLDPGDDGLDVRDVRFPAMARKGISLKGRVGSKGGDLDGVVEPNVQWKAHNYNHLMEQPTLFYAIALTLALLALVARAQPVAGLGLCRPSASPHSLVQATTNVVRWRFLLFLGGSIILRRLPSTRRMALLHLHMHG